ncbi:hypothetical protein MKW92_045564 [Papaver armeniacum]|nr:hypothetical protein MKW92_045564 [Papaver armeniacum]
MHRILTHTNGVYIVYANRSIVLACIESLPKSDGRFLRKGTWNQQRLVSIIPKQARSFKTYFQYKTRDLHLSLGGEENTASASTVKIGEQCSEGEVDIRASMLSHISKHLKQTQVMVVAGVLARIFLLVPSAGAVDALKACGCLLKECRYFQTHLQSYAANVACLQTCNNRPDETECQIKCGDLFENRVVDEFNEYAVSRKKCVPQKLGVGEFPVPDPYALVKKFNIEDSTGKWYITSGLNPTFDAFDCQLHDFHTEANKFVGNLSWRIRTPDGGFFTRTATQKFVQDPVQPGVLYNHDKEFLHYQDDWYILSSKIENNADDYVFVYYRGRNDAWDGYGGAFLYTRSSVLPDSIVPEIERAAKSVGRDFNTFMKTDNTCGPEPPLVERIERTVEEIEGEIESEVEKVERTERTLLERLFEGFNELKQEEENLLRGLSEEEMAILNDLNMEANEVDKFFGQALPLRKLR